MFKPRSPFRSPIIHRDTRRSSWHDYTSPCIYMFTIEGTKKCPLLSHLVGDVKIKHKQGGPGLALTAAGQIVKEEIDKMQTLHPEHIRIYNTVIMPDHVHFIVHVIKQLDRMITKFVGYTESAITRRFRQQGLLPRDASTFEAGVNDKIVFRRDHLKIFKIYINDNPRRLMLKRMHPDLFKLTLAMTIGQYHFNAMGNLFLLRKPMVAVHVRRAWTLEQREEYKAECVALAKNGVVLISPFIHPVEKEIRDEALSLGASMIFIRSRAMNERWKPSGKAFDLCVEGRLLVIAEKDMPDYKVDMKYELASRMNRMAEYLAQHEDERRFEFSVEK